MTYTNYICDMPLIENFLQQGVSHIRQSIIDIDDSYNNDWDILAELIQNSVDAIRKADINTGV
jgi:molecular chaperone HtpG